MKALVYDDFGGAISVRDVAEPEATDDAVIVRVMATGICRSDWHGWRGHDPDIRSLPHVPGHELAGVIEAVGARVTGWKRGRRVTVPFVAGCGVCETCRSGNHQVCDHQSQPGFTHWGSFAELVRIDYADANLVAIPDEVDFITAASLGCRFTTAFRALVAQGRAAPGEWVAVHGCGGVGLSVIMIARAMGAMIVAVDINPGALRLARSFGAEVTVNPREVDDVVAAVRARTRGGAHVSIDALGSAETCANSIGCLRTRGRHIQVGLMVGDESESPVPMAQVVSKELEIRGSHGLAAHEFPRLLDMITAGQLDPKRLVRRQVSLEEGAAYLMRMNEPNVDAAGITVIDRI